MTNAPDPVAASAAEPPPSALTVARIVYGLHGFAILVGIVGSATVIGSFVGSVPSIVAVILNYAKRRDARGTWLASHSPGRSGPSGTRSGGCSWPGSCSSP